MTAQHEDRLFGVLGEFSSADDLLRAARRAYQAGYRRMDAYTPFPVDGLAEAIGMRHTRLPLLVLAGGLAGVVVGYGLQHFANAVDYPLNVGGRPLASWPAFVPVTFEVAILFAGLTAVLGMLALNGLPLPHHPLFSVERFGNASRDRFFLCIEAADPEFDVGEIIKLLQAVGAEAVEEVTHT